MRIKIVKCEARNAVNIGNIDKFRNEAVGDFKLMDAGHDLFRGSLIRSFDTILSVRILSACLPPLKRLSFSKCGFLHSSESRH